MQGWNTESTERDCLPEPCNAITEIADFSQIAPRLWVIRVRIQQFLLENCVRDAVSGNSTGRVASPGGRYLLPRWERRIRNHDARSHGGVVVARLCTEELRASFKKLARCHNPKLRTAVMLFAGVAAFPEHAATATELTASCSSGPGTSCRARP
jgi:hypothetical protein